MASSTCGIWPLRACRALQVSHCPHCKTLGMTQVRFDCTAVLTSDYAFSQCLLLSLSSTPVSVLFPAVFHLIGYWRTIDRYTTSGNTVAKIKRDMDTRVCHLYVGAESATSHQLLPLNVFKRAVLDVKLWFDPCTEPGVHRRRRHKTRMLTCRFFVHSPMRTWLTLVLSVR